MDKKKKIAQLHFISRLAYEKKMADLARAARARDQIKAQIESLDATCLGGEAQIENGQALYRYEAWAAVRRAELKRKLAAQHAIWLSERDCLKLEFGRFEVVKRLQARYSPSNG